MSENLICYPLIIAIIVIPGVIIYRLMQSPKSESEITRRKLTKLEPVEIINKSIEFFTSIKYTVSSQSNTNIVFSRKEGGGFSWIIAIMLMIVGLIFGIIGAIIFPLLYAISSAGGGKTSIRTVMIYPQETGNIVQCDNTAFLETISGDYLP